MKQLLILLTILFFSSASFGQIDPLYSQYMFNQLSLNPAYAGSRGVLSTYLLARNQWTNSNGAPNTIVASMHGPLTNRNIGLGIQIMNDQIGPVKTNGAFASYAYRIKMKNSHLAFGLRLGSYSYRLDQSLITFRDPSENETSVLKETHLTGDFGIYYNSKSWYWGWSVLHLMDKNFANSDYSRTIQRYLTIGKAFQLSQNLIFNPSVLIKTIGQTKTRNTDINFNFLVHQKFWIGFSLRKNTMPLLFQYVVSEHLRMGISWDIPAGNEIRYLGTSTEILLQWDINVRKTKTLSPRYL